MTVELGRSRKTIVTEPARPTVVEDQTSVVIVDNVAAAEVVEMRTLVIGGDGETPVIDPVRSESLVSKRIASAVVQPLRVVYERSDTRVEHASSDDPTRATKCIGVSIESAMPGEGVPVVLDGLVDLEFSTSLNGPVYLGIDGVLTDDPTTGVVQLRVGTVLSSRRMMVRIEHGILHT